MSEYLAEYARQLESCLSELPSPSQRIDILEALCAGERVKDAFDFDFLKSPKIFARGQRLEALERQIYPDGQPLNKDLQEILSDLLATAVASEKEYDQLIRRLRTDNRATKEDASIEAGCRILVDVARKLALWIRKQPAIGEESATDWLLYELSERIPWVHYRKFTRHEEARVTGADWEWWFVSHSCSLGLRVQAKKVIDGGDHYQGLAHTNRNGLQIEMLLENARRSNLLAFYTLYYQSLNSISVKCEGKPSAGLGEGIFFTGASTLYEKFIKPGRARVEAQGIIGESNPLSCLLCCSMIRSQALDPVGRIYQHLRHYFPDSAIDPNTNVDQQGMHLKPPQYIVSFLEHSDEELPAWWEGEFRSSIENTKALLVFDMRWQR